MILFNIYRRNNNGKTKKKLRYTYVKQFLLYDFEQNDFCLKRF